MKWYKWPDEKPVIKDFMNDEFLVKFKEDKSVKKYLILTYDPDELEVWPEGVWRFGMDRFGFADDIEYWTYLDEIEEPKD